MDEKDEDDCVLELDRDEDEEDGLLLEPEMALLTVWLTRGWIWLTTLDTMSEVREEEDCWLLLRDPEEKLEPDDDPNPVLEPDDDPNPELDPEEKDDPDDEPNPELAPDEKDDPLDDPELKDD